MHIYIYNNNIYVLLLLNVVHVLYSDSRQILTPTRELVTKPERTAYPPPLTPTPVTP